MTKKSLTMQSEVLKHCHKLNTLGKQQQCFKKSPPGDQF